MSTELTSKDLCVVAKDSSRHVEDFAMDPDLDFESHAEVFNPRSLSSAISEREDEGILLAGKYFLPPGFRFHPTDQELVLYYLKRKICGLKMELNVIAEIDLYEFEPWDLHEVSCLQTKDMEWYFFCPKVRKYPRGNRENRATSIGRWKPSGKDRPIYCGSRLVGTRKCLIYYDRRSKKEERSDWVMHEFRVTDEESEKCKAKQNNFVLCRVFKKSGRGSKRGEQHGATMKEDDMESANETRMDDCDSGNHADLLNRSKENREWHIGEISGNDDSYSESTDTEVTRCPT